MERRAKESGRAVPFASGAQIINVLYNLLNYMIFRIYPSRMCSFAAQSSATRNVPSVSPSPAERRKMAKYFEE